MNRVTTSAADFGPSRPASRAKPGRNFRSHSVCPAPPGHGSSRATGLPPSAISTAPARTAWIQSAVCWWSSLTEIVFLPRRLPCPRIRGKRAPGVTLHRHEAQLPRQPAQRSPQLHHEGLNQRHLLRLHAEERGVARHGKEELDVALRVDRRVRRGEGEGGEGRREVRGLLDADG